MVVLGDVAYGTHFGKLIPVEEPCSSKTLHCSPDRQFGLALCLQPSGKGLMLIPVIVDGLTFHMVGRR